MLSLSHKLPSTSLLLVPCRSWGLEFWFQCSQRTNANINTLAQQSWLCSKTCYMVSGHYQGKNSMVQYQYEPKHSEANHSLEEKKNHLYEEKSATKKSCGLLEISSCIATLFDKKIWPLFFFNVASFVKGSETSPYWIVKTVPNQLVALTQIFKSILKKSKKL